MYFLIFRLKTHFGLFLILVILSGGCHQSLSLISSRIFGLNIFSCKLSKYELGKLLKIKLFTTLFLQNIPQICIQCIYDLRNETISQTVVIAFISSMLSIVTILIGYLRKPNKKDDNESNGVVIRIDSANSEKVHSAADGTDDTMISNAKQKAEGDITSEIDENEQRVNGLDIDDDYVKEPGVDDIAVEVELTSILEKVLNDDHKKEENQEEMIQEHVMNEVGVEERKEAVKGDIEKKARKPGVIAKGEKSFYGDPYVTQNVNDQQNANDEADKDFDDEFEDIVEF